MKRRVIIGLSGFVILAIVVLAYLFATGERGFSQRPKVARQVDVIGLDAQQTENLGWSPERLEAVTAYAATLSTDSFMVVTNDQVVRAFGDLEIPHATHSIRKAFLSALVGVHLGSGKDQIRLAATLHDLDVDDAPLPLTPLQRQASVLHLLKSLSGINHPAAASGGLQAEIDKRLGKGENEPGKIWAYNNWDYNALTTIFEKETGTGVARAFDLGLATPIGMEDFDTNAVSYLSDAALSVHRAASFRMSARDLARFGQLYLRQGRINDQQVIPKDWINRISKDFTETGLDGLRWGHGYLWWIPGPDTGLPEETFWAWGLGNQALFVIPAWNTVIVHQSDTAEFLKRFLPLVRDDGMAGEAAIEKLILSCRGAAARDSAYCIEHRFITRREFEKLMSLVVKARL